MMRARFVLFPLLTLLTLGFCLSLHGAEALEPVALPPPQTQGGLPLMQALKHRQTIRELKPDKLPTQLLANLLWAGFGINRPENAHRTAPSAMNSQEVDIYVALADGLYLYEATASRLKPVLAGDYRARTSGQPFAKEAPAVLIYVADLPRLAKAKPEQRLFYAAIDTGFISQNVYLYCASEGLATVVYAVDHEPLAATMKLKPDQRVILAQAVGYPAPQAPKPENRTGK